MRIRNSTTVWGLPARILHWVIALMIFAALGFGTYMSNVEQDLIAKFEMVQTHKSVGFTIFVLAVLRVVWRLVNRATPQLPAGMPGWQVRASQVSHRALYVLILAMPITGWLMASASPLQIQNMVWGLFAMPDPFPTGSESLTKALHTAHWLIAVAMVLILVAHIGAALKHHFVDKDTVLRRMVSGRG